MENKKTAVISPFCIQINLESFKIYYDDHSQILIYVHKEQPIMFFQTLSDLNILPPKLSAPITFIPKGPVMCVNFSCDRRFVAVLRTQTSIEIFNLIDPKHNCARISYKSKESIIPLGVSWSHSKKELKDQIVFTPILCVATIQSISFYEVSLKAALLIKSIKLEISSLWSNRLNQLTVVSETGSGRLHIFTVRDLAVVTMTLPEAPTANNTFVSTLYRATYLYQYSVSRGSLFIFAYSNRDNEFKYYNTVALPLAGSAVFSVSDNLVFIHYLNQHRSFAVDFADVPFDPAANISSPDTIRNAVTCLELRLPTEDVPEVTAAMQDPVFQQEVVSIPIYHSYDVQITSTSIGLELESTFQKLFSSSFDGRVHGCFDNSAYVKAFAPTISPLLKAQVEIGSYITHVNDHLVVGNTFSSVLQLLRQEKRPIRIRFECGRVGSDDPYVYGGDLPILCVDKVSDDVRDAIYDSSLFPNNVCLNTKCRCIYSVHVLLTAPTSIDSAADDLRFLLRRRTRVPTCLAGEWDVEDSVVTAYPRKLALELLQGVIPEAVTTGRLEAVFAMLNMDYASLMRRSATSKDMIKYMEIAAETGCTRELNGNVVITQKEMFQLVLLPLKKTLSASEYQLIVMTYVQSLLHVQIPVDPILSNHIIQEILAEGGSRAFTSLQFLHANGVLTMDTRSAQCLLLESRGDSLPVELCLQILRSDGDCETLLNYYYREQMLDELLLLLSKYSKNMKDFYLWILNAIKLSTLLYDDDANIDHLYRTYHFIKHYQPDVLKDLKYPNRLGGLIGFAEEGSEAYEGSKVLSKGETMKQLLQTIKETIFRSAFN